MVPPPAVAASLTPVTLHGQPDSFGSLGETLPSGHQLDLRPVPAWEFPPGVQAGATAVTSDGTVLLAGRRQHAPAGYSPPSAGGLVVAAYHPDSGDYRTVRLAADHPPEASVTGLVVLPGTDTVVVTVDAGGGPVGSGPVLAVLTGAEPSEPWWSVTEPQQPYGPQVQLWTAETLAAPYGLTAPVRLPDSADLIVARPAGSGGGGASLLALRPSRPEGTGQVTGQVTVSVAAEHPYPADAPAELAVRDLRVDPTGTAGDERFVAVLFDPEGTLPGVVQELRYDTRSGAFESLSAPVLPGDRVHDDGPYFGYSAAAYDRDGNLWVARHQWLAGGKLAVYARGAAGRPAEAGEGQQPAARGLDRAACRYDPQATPDTYVVASGEAPVWGHPCPPDYDILSARHLPGVISLVPEPTGLGMTAISLSGSLLPVRASVGDRHGELHFAVGNAVDTAPRLLPTRPGSIVAQQEGAFDGNGRLWFAAGHALPGEPDLALPQYLYEMDIDRLFDPVPVQLPEVPGQLAIIQAGHTATVDTEQLAGEWAAVDVDPRAYASPCLDGPSVVGCSYDGMPGSGFLLSHRTGLGHLEGVLDYPVDAPTAGAYRVAYRVFTFESVTDAAITLEARTDSYTTSVSTDGRWRTVTQTELLTLPAGVHTIRLAPPEGGGGWALSWFSLQRT